MTVELPLVLFIFIMIFAVIGGLIVFVIAAIWAVYGICMAVDKIIDCWEHRRDKR